MKQRKIIIMISLVLVVFTLCFDCVIAADWIFYGNLPKSTYARERLNGNEQFDNDCVLVNRNWYSVTDDVRPGAYEFFEKTGIQFYLLDLDLAAVEEIQTAEDMDTYLLEYIESNIENPENCLVYMQVMGPDRDLDSDGHAESVHPTSEWFFGDNTRSVLDSQGLTILQTYWEACNADWDYESIPFAFNKICEQLMNPGSVATRNTIKTALLIVFNGGSILAMVLSIRSYIKHKRDLEILNTPLEDLADDMASSDINM